MTAADTPTSVRLRAYNVGFGDCLLLTTTYAKAAKGSPSERHMLIDYGTREAADGGPTLDAIGARIVDACPGGLDVLVATHRHSDHISGFGFTATRAHIDALAPKLVVRPWTDVPNETTADPALGLGPNSTDFIALLRGLEDETSRVTERFSLSSGFAKRAKELAAMSIKNANAVAALEDWATAGTAKWLKAEDQLDLTDFMPGVTVRVLGPPTLETVPNLQHYASSSGEYWLRLATADDLGALVNGAAPAAASSDSNSDSGSVTEPGGVGAGSWLLEELAKEGPRQVMDIVGGFDEVLNNTSLILLVTIGERSILLAGDAQLENWSYTLDQALGVDGTGGDQELADQLANIDVYKVGHHGSRNATPKRLYGLWTSRGKKRPLISVLTTKQGVYDETTEGLVPKPELLAGLRDVGPLHSTDELPTTIWWFDLVASTAGKKGFVRHDGPTMPA